MIYYYLFVKIVKKYLSDDSVSKDVGEEIFIRRWWEYKLL